MEPCTPASRLSLAAHASGSLCFGRHLPEWCPCMHCTSAGLHRSAFLGQVTLNASQAGGSASHACMRLQAHAMHRQARHLAQASLHVQA